MSCSPYFCNRGGHTLLHFYATVVSTPSFFSIFSSKPNNNPQNFPARCARGFTWLDSTLSLGALKAAAAHCKGHYCGMTSDWAVNKTLRARIILAVVVLMLE